MAMEQVIFFSWRVCLCETYTTSMRILFSASKLRVMSGYTL